MPRIFDYSLGNGEGVQTILLPEPRYGRHEITPQEKLNLDHIADSIQAVSFEAGSFKYKISPQFLTWGQPAPQDWTRAMDAAHEQLSSNMTGAWLWHEERPKGASRIDTWIYIERTSDQEVAAQNLSGIFKYQPDSIEATVAIAVWRGALPFSAISNGRTDIPSDFYEYLRGKRENYRAPYIASLGA
ncbi:MAG: hypothetical protein SFW62_04595 [Alphaproteobacteria bacterium]|nr:hypothetical protein [Alphaproteobacteria bacterium]